MSRTRVLTDPERLYELFSDADGNHYLEVVCGGVGMYQVRIELTAAQVERYRELGREFLDDLAFRVGKGELSKQVVKRGDREDGGREAWGSKRR